MLMDYTTETKLQVHPYLCKQHQYNLYTTELMTAIAK